MKRLRTIYELSERLEALAKARGVAENVSSRMIEEAESVRWAYDEIRRIYFTEVLCVVGHDNFVASIPGLKPEHITGQFAAEQLMTVSIFDPEKTAVELIHNYLVGPDWPGDKLKESRLPKWLHCEKYYAAKEEDTANDSGKRAMCLHCVVFKSWLAETGLAKARVMLNSWLIDMFKAMKWENIRTA